MVSLSNKPARDARADGRATERTLSSEGRRSGLWLRDGGDSLRRSTPRLRIRAGSPSDAPSGRTSRFGRCGWKAATGVPRRSGETQGVGAQTVLTSQGDETSAVAQGSRELQTRGTVRGLFGRFKPGDAFFGSATHARWQHQADRTRVDADAPTGRREIGGGQSMRKRSRRKRTAGRRLGNEA